MNIDNVNCNGAVKSLVEIATELKDPVGYETEVGMAYESGVIDMCKTILEQVEINRYKGPQMKLSCGHSTDDLEIAVEMYEVVSEDGVYGVEASLVCENCLNDLCSLGVAYKNRSKAVEEAEELNSLLET